MEGNMEDLKDMIKALPDEPFNSLKRWLVIDEVDRRNKTKALVSAIDTLVTDGVIEDNAPPVSEEESRNIDAYPEWVDPGTKHSKMYRFGQRVRHNGRVWESSTQQLNSWEPGGEGVYEFIWKDITDIITAPEPEPEPDLPPEPDEPTDTQVPAEPGTEEGAEQDAEGPTTPQWSANVAYNINDVVEYNGITYKVLQDHTSADHWRPDQVPSLYSAV